MTSGSHTAEKVNEEGTEMPFLDQEGGRVTLRGPCLESRPHPFRRVAWLRPLSSRRGKKNGALIMSRGRFTYS